MCPPGVKIPSPLDSYRLLREVRAEIGEAIAPNESPAGETKARNDSFLVVDGLVLDTGLGQAVVLSLSAETPRSCSQVSQPPRPAYLLVLVIVALLFVRLLLCDSIVRTQLGAAPKVKRTEKGLEGIVPKVVRCW